jgi:hypothetical protein
MWFPGYSSLCFFKCNLCRYGEATVEFKYGDGAKPVMTTRLSLGGASHVEIKLTHNP